MAMRTAGGLDAPPPSAIAWDARGFDLARLRDECSQTETLHSHVRMQLTGVRVGEEDRALLDALIENIDDDGYFSGSMHALCAEAGRSIEDGQRLGCSSSCSSCRLAAWARAIWPNALRCKSTTAFPMRT